MLAPRSTCCVVFFVLIVGLAASGPAAHAAIINGDFSAGLDGWTVSDPNFVTVVDGRAVIREDDSFFPADVTLHQDFTVPGGAQRLLFTLFALTTEPAGFFLPDAFNVALLNPSTGQSLVPTVDAFTDAYYIRDLVDGITAGEAAAGVTQEPSPDALPLQVGVDLSGLDNQEARILFRLIAGGPDFDASITIDDVHIFMDEPPVTELFAHAGGPYFLPGPGLLTLDATGSTPFDAISHFRWDLTGDGFFDNAFGATPTVDFPVPGNFDIFLQIEDALGATATADSWVLVAAAEVEIPEPASLAIWALGLLGAFGSRWRRSKRRHLAQTPSSC